jgi:ribosomal protein S27AE
LRGIPEWIAQWVAGFPLWVAGFRRPAPASPLVNTHAASNKRGQVPAVTARTPTAGPIGTGFANRLPEAPGRRPGAGPLQNHHQGLGGESVEMATMKRGVGYCENTDCEDYAKGVFLLNHGDTFYCPRCRQLGKVEKERGFYTGNSDIFKEVRVEYNFDPINGVYREIAIVRDESLWGRNNVYTLQSPLIKTEKRALKVAEAILANLNRYRGLLNGDEIPRTTEIILSFDDSFDEFQRKVQQLGKELEQSGLRDTAR